MGAAVFFIPTRTVATRGIPSGPAWSSSMRASGHVAGAVSSVRNALSPILGVGPPVCHLERGWSVCRYSFDQRHQKPSTIFCRSAHLRRDDTFCIPIARSWSGKQGVPSQEVSCVSGRGSFGSED